MDDETRELGMMQARRRDLMTPREVAALFRCDPKTVTRWANAGRIRFIRTPGGHRRFFASDVRRILMGGAENPRP